MNNSTLYTGIGILGIVVTGVTAYMAGKRIWKDKTERIYQKALNTLDSESKAKVLNEVEKISNEEKSKEEVKEEAIEIVKSLIPTVAAGAISTYCVAKGEKINKEEIKKAKDNFNMYKQSAKEIFGEKGHNRIVQNIDKAYCNRDTVVRVAGAFSTSKLDFGVDEDETIHTFYDTYSKRYFESTISKVLQAQYHINRNLVLGMSPSVNMYYDFLGLDRITNGENIGWSYDAEEGFIDFDNTKTVLEDGMEILMINMVNEPEPFDYEEAY